MVFIRMLFLYQVEVLSPPLLQKAFSILWGT